jgi:hypothetical protein
MDSSLPVLYRPSLPSKRKRILVSINLARLLCLRDGNHLRHLFSDEEIDGFSPVFWSSHLLYEKDDVSPAMQAETTLCTLCVSNK